MKRIIVVLFLSLTLQHNPVYNVKEADPLKDPNLPLVPQLTTNYEQMMVDRSKRLITLGESQKDEKHIEFSPVHHYDEDVEFISTAVPLKKQISQPSDDKLILAKETEIEQMIYSLYELKNEDEKKEFLRGESSPIDQFLVIIGNANQGLSLQEIHVLDKIREYIIFLRNQEESIKDTTNQDNLDCIRRKVKSLSFLIDQRDFQKKVVESLDTGYFTYNKTMQQLDTPLKYYSDRVNFLIKKGEVYDQAAFADIANFHYFAQRKSKLQMIYRKMSIIRAKNMTGDLEGQQSAIINLLEELGNELRTCEEGLRPLEKLQNQMAIIAPLENVQKINQVMRNCIESLNRYPEIQFVCKEIEQTHEFSKVNTFKKLSFLIKQEIAAYEHSIQSLISQQQLGRAAQDAVNLRYVSNVYQNLNRMATECLLSQKKITANQKITNYISTINTFRQKDQTIVLALQNIENVLFETNKGTFWNADDAQNQEFTSGNEHFNMKLNTQRMLIDKLTEAAGKCAVETTPENSHQAEELLENLISFMQKQDKLIKIKKSLAQKENQSLKTLFEQEIEQLKLRQTHTQEIINRLTQLENQVWQQEILSAQEQSKSLTKEKFLRAMAKLRIDQAFGMFTINERRSGADYLAQAHKEIDNYLQNIISSTQDVEEQLSILQKPQELKNGVKFEDYLYRITENQPVVIANAALEDFLNSIRISLLDGKGVEAKDKIALFINKDEDHKHENEISQNDIKQMAAQTKLDFEGDDYDLANRHSEQLLQMIQQSEKQADILYTIRSVLTFEKDNKNNAMEQSVEDLKLSIQKEFFSIEGKQKQIQKIQKQISSLLEKKSISNVEFNQELYSIRQKVFINNRYYDLTKLAIQLAGNNDQESARKNLKELLALLQRDIQDLEVSRNLVDQQQQILVDGNSKDSIELQRMLEQVQQLSRQQVNVMTDDILNNKQNEFVNFRNEKNHLKSLEILGEIEKKGIDYLTLVEQKIIELKYAKEPKTVVKNIIMDVDPLKQKSSLKIKKNRKHQK